MNGMTVCSGIGAPEVAAPWIDWRYQAEIDAFPIAVLAHRFPGAINLGDMSRFKEWPDATVDVLCGGTPCQSFSVAGLRRGLDDPRGNLMLTYLAIAARYRPRWIVWENVPGVLSSNGGRDFGAFLGGLGQLGYGFAYRVLDAQYTRTRSFPRAVPQRRRRVFVVGYLGDWRRAAAVLFDGESLRGNPPPRREAGESIARGAASWPCNPWPRGRRNRRTHRRHSDALRASQGAGTSRRCWVIRCRAAPRGERRGFERTGDTRGQDCLIPQVSLCLNAGGMGRIDGESETFVPVARGARSRLRTTARTRRQTCRRRFARAGTTRATQTQECRLP
jgi:site-specific DNA-cytosine methylase